MKKLLLLGFMLIGHGLFANDLPKFNNASPLCGIDFSKIGNQPLLEAKKWVQESPALNVFIAIATIWHGHPAVRTTSLKSIEANAVVISTSSLFNMVTHFHTNNQVAITIIIKKDNGCFSQIRAEGTIEELTTQTNRTWIHEKNGKVDKAPHVDFKITPVWMELSTAIISRHIYEDVQFRFRNGSWQKEESVRKVYLK